MNSRSLRVHFMQQVIAEDNTTQALTWRFHTLLLWSYLHRGLSLVAIIMMSVCNALMECKLKILIILRYPNVFLLHPFLRMFNTQLLSQAPQTISTSQVLLKYVDKTSSTVLGPNQVIHGFLKVSLKTYKLRTVIIINAYMSSQKFPYRNKKLSSTYISKQTKSKKQDLAPITLSQLVRLCQNR